MFPDDSKRIQKFSLYDSITHVHMVGQFVLSVMSLVISTYAYDACGYPQYVYGHYVVMSGSFLFASLMFVSYYCAPRRIRWYHLAGLKLNLLAGGILLMGLSVALGVTGFACELQGFRTDWGRNQIARKCLAGIFPGYQLHNPNCPASMVKDYNEYGPAYLVHRVLWMSANLVLIVYAVICILGTINLLFWRSKAIKSEPDIEAKEIDRKLLAEENRMQEKNSEESEEADNVEEEREKNDGENDDEENENEEV